MARGSQFGHPGFRLRNDELRGKDPNRRDRFKMLKCLNQKPLQETQGSFHFRAHNGGETNRPYIYWIQPISLCKDSEPHFSSHAVFEVKKALFFLKIFIYLFVERGEGREKERERNISVWLHLHAPYWGPGPQPKHVPWLGIEPATLWFTGQHSIHCATPVKAKRALFFTHYQ